MKGVIAVCDVVNPTVGSLAARLLCVPGDTCTVTYTKI